MDKRICFFFPTIEAGGIEKALVGIAAGMVAQGNKVTLFHSSCQDRTSKALPEGIVRFQVAPPKPRFPVNRKAWEALILLPNFYRFLRRERPDCIISFQSSSLAIPIALFAGVPIIHRESSNCKAALAAQKRWVLRNLVRLGKKLTYRFCSAIVVNSKESARALSELSGLPENRICLIYNSVDTDTIRSLAGEDTEAWFGGGAATVVSLGRLTWEKNFSLLIRAFKFVRERRNARLVIIGEGGERERLEALVRDLGLEGSVMLPGYRPNPYPYLAKASVFVMTSLFEGLPNAMLEAVALGVPVVSVDFTSGPREILCDGKAGRLVPQESPDLLGQAILDLLENPLLARAYVDEATKSAFRFDPGHMSRQYGQVVERVCGSAA